mmetsp:Transcript_14873/g.23143  ORF Transcript_14873/g.23143 Transcript_14873/m.23143 type:complete len:312 (+) Transcript_14873:245-1180(+)|eukprot:CAMPEP_0184294708 /NCGR_PEP_ID=MMETSP1049-20130417/5829_1 /TAXON_ID=77928 /ORGANISM="Proteomonas sulcata, Strain CCMP704" /LENGTH=311 /DNA_ID=CAMNT_0026603075 /DNA_START=108 /DNA_END=1043 /DNA_ORIENTATION=-
MDLSGKLESLLELVNSGGEQNLAQASSVSKECLKLIQELKAKELRSEQRFQEVLEKHKQDSEELRVLKQEIVLERQAVALCGIQIPADKTTLSKTAGQVRSQEQLRDAQKDRLTALSVSLSACPLISHSVETEQAGDNQLSSVHQFWQDLRAADAGNSECKNSRPEGGAGEAPSQVRPAEREELLRSLRAPLSDIVAFDLTIASCSSSVNGRQGFRCTFSTRRRGTVVRFLAEDAGGDAEGGPLTLSCNVNLPGACEEASKRWSEGMRAVELVQSVMWQAIDRRVDIKDSVPSPLNPLLDQSSGPETVQKQ